MNDDIDSLSHSKWNCKYHVVFAPKYKSYGTKRLEIGAILRQLCNWEGVSIIEAEVYPDYVYMLIEIPPKMSVSSFMGYLKGKSSLMINELIGISLIKNIYTYKGNLKIRKYSIKAENNNAGV